MPRTQTKGFFWINRNPAIMSSASSESENNYLKDMKKAALEECSSTLALLSYEYEWKRYESLLGASGRMIAGLSLVVVALVTALQVSDLFDVISSKLLAVEALIAILLLAASVMLAVLAQFRFKYKGVASPSRIVDWLGEMFERVEEGDNVATAGFVADSLAEPHDTLCILNDRLAKYIDVCVILLLLALGFIASSVLFDCLFLLFWR